MQDTVIVIPLLTEFIAEIKRAGGSVTGPEIRMLHTQRFENRVLPACFLGTRLTARTRFGTLVWAWERDFYINAEGQPTTIEQRNRAETFSKANTLIVEALKLAGIPARKLRPGTIALDRNLEMVKGEPDVLRFSKDGDTLAVEIDPDWAKEQADVEV